MGHKEYNPHVNVTPNAPNGDCPHCGANWWIRCIPPRDYRQCGYYLAKQQRERGGTNAIRCSTVRFEEQTVRFSKVNCPTCFRVDCECGKPDEDHLWDIWYAWYPVRVKPRGWAWLQYVWTRRGEHRVMS